MRKSLVCVLMLFCALNVFSSSRGGIVGTWNLSKIESKKVPGGNPKFVSGPLFMNWKAEEGVALGFFQVKDIPGMVMPMGGGMLLRQLKDITFQKDGNIVVTYAVPSQGTTAGAAPTWVKSEPGSVTYKMEGEQLYIFPDMNKITSSIPADSLKANPELSESIDVLKNGIPVNYTIDGRKATLFVDKAFVEKIIPIIMSFMGSVRVTGVENASDFVKAAFEASPGALQKTMTLEIGLNLEK